MKDLQDKVAVVTGAASGIGKGITKSLLKKGVKVVLSDIEDKALKTTVSYFQDCGANVHGILADVSNPRDVAKMVEKTLEKYGAVHILCNNAGVYAGSSPSWQSTLDDWNWIVSVNLMGVVHGIQAFLPVMIEQKGEGHIVNTSSIAGLILPGGTLYRTTKTAIVALSESLHQELRRDAPDINISVLCPAMVDTNLLHSNRNRPKKYGESGPQASGVNIERVKQAFKDGLSPRVLGDQVVKAIFDERFYILPNPEYTEQVMHRAKLIAEGRNPSPRVS